MDHGDGAEIEEFGRNGGFLSGDDDAAGIMALFADDCEEVLGKGFGGWGVLHELMGLIEADEHACFGTRREEKGEKNVEECARCAAVQERVAEVDDGEGAWDGAEEIGLFG